MAQVSTSSLMAEVEAVRQAARAQNAWRAECLPMIASENVLSPRALEMLVTDFHGRYAEGLPGRRYYQGTKHFDEVETRAIELAKRLFRCTWANVQSTSGTVSNMAALKALAMPGDTITAVSTADGGHISHAKMGAVGLRGLRVVEYPWDAERMTVDVDGAARTLRTEKPKVALFGQSVFLFPTPVKELAPVAHEVGARVFFDGAHVLGLIAGGQFQDPFREGADVLTGSTHKTLPGPQGGVNLAHNFDPGTEEGKKFQRSLETGVFPGVVSSYHLHHVAAKAIAFAEHLEFGQAYARQTVQNARALAQALHEQGFKVLGETLGFTRSHQCLVQVGQLGEGKGKWAAEQLEKANIITNMNMIPGDTKAMNPSGLRLGVQELTRLGMGEGHMREVASLYARLLLRGEDPAGVREDVRRLRAQFQRLQFCFNDQGRSGYEFRELA
jgi:glycine hydroxymethyltransferase